MEKENADLEKTISQKELTEKLKLSRWAIYRAIKEGHLHPKRTVEGNMFSIDEVESWLESGLQEV